MPLNWRDVTAKLDPKKFTMQAALRRLVRQTRDPMAELLAGFKRAPAAAR